MPHGVFHLSAALATLAKVLRDPDIHVRAVLCYSPQPNEMQKEHFVQAYLDAARPADALEWLKADWGRRESTRRSLLFDPLVAHMAFEQQLKAMHPRKVAFWAEVARVGVAQSADELLDP